MELGQGPSALGLRASRIHRARAVPLSTSETEAQSQGERFLTQTSQTQTENLAVCLGQHSESSSRGSKYMHLS